MPKPAPARIVGYSLLVVGLVWASISLTGRFRASNPSVAPQTPGSVSGGEPKFYWETGEKPRSLVPLEEIIEGGPPPDGIPPIDKPQFIDPTEATWLKSDEPVLGLENNGVARAYPLQILVWHEIVNDVVGGRPVVVTYCPLCNTGIVYDRTVDGEATTFGTSGRLYNSDLVMYDRATKSLWVQFSGQAVVGPRIGKKLEMLDASIVSLAEFRATYPHGMVLSRLTGHSRPYGESPYAGYDSNVDPFLFKGKDDPRLPAITRVVGVETGGEAIAFVSESLFERGKVSALNERVGTDDIALFFKRGTRSVLDEGVIARGKDVGQSGAFLRKVGTKTLSFSVAGGVIRDDQTGSTWTVLGRATAGSLKGTSLTAVRKVDTFWFAWAVFLPETAIWKG